MTTRTCATCQAFLVDDGETIGSCQLNPPVYIGGGTDYWVFPPVHPLAFCVTGWQSKAKAEKAEKAPGEAMERRTKVPEDFTPNARACEIAAAQGQNVHALAAAFKDHYKGLGEVRADWQASFRTWLRKDLQFREKRR